MVWSPSSNLFLYDETLDLLKMKSHHVRLALGADWALTGSKTQLQEIAVARNYLRRQHIRLAGPKSSNERELAIMATQAAAEALGLPNEAGRLAKNYRADILVLRSTTTHIDPYEALASARERDVALVLVGGEALYGDPDLVSAVGLPKGACEPEPFTVCGSPKSLCIQRTDPADLIRIPDTRAGLISTLTQRIPPDTLAPLQECK